MLLPIGHPDLGVGGQENAGKRAVDSASHALACPAGSPSSNSVVSSPKYQRLPSSSSAYQSNVSSTMTPSSATRSWTTRASTPMTIRVRSVTVTSTRWSPSRYTHCSRRHRPERVVDLRRESRRVDLDWVAALRQRFRPVGAAASGGERDERKQEGLNHWRQAGLEDERPMRGSRQVERLRSGGRRGRRSSRLRCCGR